MRVGFSLYEVLTRITPGVVFISSFVITPNFNLLDQSTIYSSNPSLFIIGVLSLISGEVVNLIRVNFLPVPPTFHRFLFHETGREEFLGSLDRWLLKLGVKIPERKSIYTSTERELYYELTSRYGLENNYENTIRDLFTLMINDLDDKMSSRTARFQRTFIFAENMTLAIGGFVMVFGLRGIFGDSSEQALALLMSFFAVLLLLLLLLAFHLYGRVEYRYVDSLVSEFYVENSTEGHRDPQ